MPALRAGGKFLGSPGLPAGRLARWMAAACDSPDDLRTIGAWSHYVGVSVTTFCETCRLLQVRPHDARDLARVLRALRLAGSEHCHLESVLDVSDRRTYRKLLTRAAVTAVVPTGFSITDLIARQTFLPAGSETLAALVALLT